MLVKKYLIRFFLLSLLSFQPFKVYSHPILDQVPVMKGLVFQGYDAPVNSDAHVKAFELSGNIIDEDVYEYYERVLEELGWEELEKGHFEKDGYLLNLSFNMKGQPPQLLMVLSEEIYEGVPDVSPYIDE